MVLSWLMECTMIQVQHSDKSNLPHLTVAGISNHQRTCATIYFEFCSESTSLSLHCYVLACKENMVTTLKIFETWYCDVCLLKLLTGWQPRNLYYEVLSWNKHLRLEAKAAVISHSFVTMTCVQKSVVKQQILSQWSIGTEGSVLSFKTHPPWL